MSELFLFKLIKPLVENGLIETVRGRRGGIRLGRPAVGDHAARHHQAHRGELRHGGVLRGRRRVLPAGRCNCDLNAALREALGAFFNVLDSYTIAERLGLSLAQSSAVSLRERLGGWPRIEQAHLHQPAVRLHRRGAFTCLEFIDEFDDRANRIGHESSLHCSGAKLADAVVNGNSGSITKRRAGARSLSIRPPIDLLPPLWSIRGNP
jgi:DNA-binding IscR family transcriptional regulator